MPSNDGHQLNEADPPYDPCRPTPPDDGAGPRLKPHGREMLPEKAWRENFRPNLDHLMYKRLLNSLLPPVTPTAGVGREDLRGDAQCQLARRAALTSHLEKSSAGPADRRWRERRRRTQRLRRMPSIVRPVANPHLRAPGSVEVAEVRWGPRNSRRPTWRALQRSQLPQHRGRPSSRRRQQHSRKYRPLVHNHPQLFHPHSTNHASRTHQ